MFVLIRWSEFFVHTWPISSQILYFLGGCCWETVKRIVKCGEECWKISSRCLEIGQNHHFRVSAEVRALLFSSHLSQILHSLPSFVHCSSPLLLPISCYLGQSCESRLATFLFLPKKVRQRLKIVCYMLLIGNQLLDWLEY